MNKIRNYIKELCDIMTVSGFEYREKEKILSIDEGFFDEAIADNVGSYLFIKRSNKKDAPRLLIDTHIDTIGMIVTEICDGGFVKFTSVGGLDAHVLGGCEVFIYGKERVYGVITSTPPHLLSKEDRSKLDTIESLYIDTGYSKEALSEIVSVGSPVAFAEDIISLENNVICGPSFDNKASCASALDAIIETDKDELSFDVYLLFSCREESGAFAGAFTGATRAKPDLAISIDVNFAKAPDVDEFVSVKMGKGPSVSLSCVTNRKYTKKVVALAEREGIPYQLVAEPNNVGTNGNALGLTNLGVICVDLGIPLGSMHTFSETVSLCDCKSVSLLLSSIMKSEKLADEVKNERKN